LYYLDQSLKDGEEIEAHERALELLSVAKKEHDQKLAVEDRLRAAEEQAR
jgi:hypothetical protein